MWLDMYNKLVSWVENHEGTEPSTSSTDPEEQRIADWASACRYSLWVKNHDGRRPSESSTDPQEKSLADWFEMWVDKELWCGNFSDYAQELWESFEAWRTETAEAHAKDLWKSFKAFKAWRRGAAPCASSSSSGAARPVGGIRYLGERSKGAEPGAVDICERWQSQYEALERWLREHQGKEPLKSSTDPEEKDLASFVGYWRGAVYNNSCSVFRKVRLQQLPGLLFHKREDAWEKSFAALQDWLSKHDGKYPSATANDAAEKCLGKWICK